MTVSALGPLTCFSFLPQIYLISSCIISIKTDVDKVKETLASLGSFSSAEGAQKYNDAIDILNHCRSTLSQLKMPAKDRTQPVSCLDIICKRLFIDEDPTETEVQEIEALIREIDDCGLDLSRAKEVISYSMVAYELQTKVDKVQRVFQSFYPFIKKLSKPEKRLRSISKEHCWKLISILTELAEHRQIVSRLQCELLVHSEIGSMNSFTSKDKNILLLAARNSNEVGMYLLCVIRQIVGSAQKNTALVKRSDVHQLLTVIQQITLKIFDQYVLHRTQPPRSLLAPIKMNLDLINTVNHLGVCIIQSRNVSPALFGTRKTAWFNKFKTMSFSPRLPDFQKVHIDFRCDYGSNLRTPIMDQNIAKVLTALGSLGSPAAAFVSFDPTTDFTHIPVEDGLILSRAPTGMHSILVRTFAQLGTHLVDGTKLYQVIDPKVRNMQELALTRIPNYGFSGSFSTTEHYHVRSKKTSITVDQRTAIDNAIQAFMRRIKVVSIPLTAIFTIAEEGRLAADIFEFDQKVGSRYSEILSFGMQNWTFV